MSMIDDLHKIRRIEGTCSRDAEVDDYQSIRNKASIDIATMKNKIIEQASSQKIVENVCHEQNNTISKIPQINPNKKYSGLYHTYSHMDNIKQSTD